MTFVKNAARVKFILVDPSHPGNIGAASRAIQTMGFQRLAVVNPLEADFKSHPEAHAFATHSVNVLESAEVHATLEEALKGVTRAYAMTGYDREYGPPIAPLRTCAEEARDLMEEVEEAEVAFVFGTERSGLTNEQIGLCQMCCAIPANPECDSLNLAQAVQVAAYELQMTLRGTALDAHANRFTQDRPATPQAIALFFGHLEEAMLSCGALDPKKPKFMMERLRRLFSRAGLTQIEVDLLRGICASIICPKKDRMGRKISERITRKIEQDE
jgi:tRNA/rRNA methyltransferase